MNDWYKIFSSELGEGFVRQFSDGLTEEELEEEYERNSHLLQGILMSMLMDKGAL